MNDQNTPQPEQSARATWRVAVTAVLALLAAVDFMGRWLGYDLTGLSWTPIAFAVAAYLAWEHDLLSMETVKTIGYAVSVALIIRTLLVEPFNIPSGSMIPTLLIGDYLFVSKYSYGYSKHSLPFSPDIFEGRIVEDTPERGDVVVFKVPTDNSTDYIKRVIGLPGDRIQVKDGILFINGNPVERQPMGPASRYVEGGAGATGFVFTEFLPPDGRPHLIREVRDEDGTKVYEVPPGHYFMMGDNRDNSQDSRSLVGFVPGENLVGRAEFIFFSVEPGAAHIWEIWRWPAAIRWDRLFEAIK